MTMNDGINSHEKDTKLTQTQLLKVLLFSDVVCLLLNQFFSSDHHNNQCTHGCALGQVTVKTFVCLIINKHNQRIIKL